jgi:hypothetical protein
VHGVRTIGQRGLFDNLMKQTSMNAKRSQATKRPSETEGLIWRTSAACKLNSRAIASDHDNDRGSNL